MPRGNTFALFGFSNVLITIGDHFRLHLFYFMVFPLLTMYMCR